MQLTWTHNRDCKRRNLAVIEDAAEAPGATYKATIGNPGRYISFCFATTGHWGSGIALSCDPALDKNMRIYRDHGMSREKRYVRYVRFPIIV